MGLPNLNWPANLYTDVSDSDTAIEPSATAGCERTLWTEMVDAWTGQGTILEFPWRAQLFRSKQLAW